MKLETRNIYSETSTDGKTTTMKTRRHFLTILVFRRLFKNTVSSVENIQRRK